MKELAVTRSVGRAWGAALVALPFVAYGADVAVLPRVFPGYVRRVDVLAERWGIPLAAADGPEEVWGWLFFAVGLAVAVWSLRELAFPARLLVLDESGISFGAVAGPGSGGLRVPWDEVAEVAPARLSEHGRPLPALAVRLADVGRLPERPWGAVWAGPVLVVRAAGWDPSPARVAARAVELGGLAEVDGYVVEVDADHDGVTVERSPGDPTELLPSAESFNAGRRRLLLGAALVAAAVLVAIVLSLLRAPGGAYLLGVALGLAGAVLMAEGVHRLDRPGER